MSRGAFDSESVGVGPFDAESPARREVAPAGPSARPFGRGSGVGRHEDRRSALRRFDTGGLVERCGAGHSSASSPRAGSPD